MLRRIVRWLRGRDAAPAPAPEPEPEPEPEPDAGPDAVVVVPIGDELDLHTFAPRDVPDLVREYLDAAQAAGLTVVRVVHGKGTGTLRRTVHAALDRHAAVASYRQGGDREGGWGATVVTLHPRAR